MSIVTRIFLGLFACVAICFSEQPALSIIVPSTHMDIDYTGLVSTCMAKYDSFIDQAIKITEKNPNASYTIEHTSAVAHFLASRPDMADRLRKQLQSGRLEIGSSWTTPHYADLDPELLLREIAYARYFLRSQLGYTPIVVKNGELSDPVPQLAQVCAKSGIEVFQSCKINQHYGLSMPFRYIALDGSEVFFIQKFYGFREKIGGPYDKVRDCLRYMIVDRRYPVGITIDDGKGDDVFPDVEGIARSCAAWNASRDANEYGAELRSGTIAEYVREIKQKARAGRPQTTTPGIGMTQHGEQLYFTWGWHKYHDRAAAVQALVMAEKLLTLLEIAGLSPYPSEALDHAWEQCMAVSTHNWGVQARKGDDELPLFADSARRCSENLVQTALSNLSRAIPPAGAGIPVVVVNLLNGIRNAPVSLGVAIPKDMTPVVVDSAGRACVTQTIGKDSVCFIAPDLPSFGWQTYYIGDAAKTGKAATSDVKTSLKPVAIENTYYKISGTKKGIVSIYDKTNKRELVGPRGVALWEHAYNTPFGSNVTAERMDRQEKSSQLKFSDVSVSEAGPAKATLLFGGNVSLRATLYAGQNRVEISIVSDNPPGSSLYALHCDLNLSDTKCKMRGGFQFGSIEYPQTPQWKGSAELLKWSKATDGVAAWVSFYNESWHPRLEEHVSAKLAWANWLDFSEDKSFGITIAMEKPTNVWIREKDDLSLVKKTLFRGGKGSYCERFFIKAGAGTWKERQAARLGEEAQNPVLASVCPKGATGAMLPSRASCVSLEPSTKVFVTALKKAWDKGGYVLRFYEATDSSLSVNVSFGYPFKQQYRLVHTNMAEEPRDEIGQTSPGMHALRIRGFGIETLEYIP